MTTADQKNIRKEERWKKLFLQIRTQKRKIEFYVLEETQINGKKFLFVTEEEDGDSEAYILKEIADEMMMLSTRWWKMTTNFAALGKVFAELIDDADIEY